MNVAILIGVSDYVNLGELPACKSDLALVKGMTERTKRFDKVLVLDDNQDSKSAKDQLARFIEGIRGAEIGEVFFYFSGHGGLYSEDVLLKLTDYSKREPLATSLSNTEIDTHLRSLNAGLTIKAIDACHSGQHYIKNERDGIKQELEKGSARYKRCYFMFSCEATQQSWQNQQYSYFTRSFCRAVLKYTQGGREARYNEITQVIADDFANDKRQKPIFVSQAHATEVFATGTVELTEFLTDKLTAPDPGPPRPTDSGEQQHRPATRRAWPRWVVGALTTPLVAAGLIYTGYLMRGPETPEDPQSKILGTPPAQKGPNEKHQVDHKLQTEFIGEVMCKIEPDLPVRIFSLTAKHNDQLILLQVRFTDDEEPKATQDYTLILRDPALKTGLPPFAWTKEDKGAFEMAENKDLTILGPTEPIYFKAFFSLSSPLDFAAFTLIGDKPVEVMTKLTVGKGEKLKASTKGYRIEHGRLLTWTH